MKNIKNYSKNDEYYTPKILVYPIIKYINLHKNPIVLSPFDTETSEFVIAMKENNITVKYGHISTGQDFFTYDYGEYDMVVSNPPFSLKKKIYEKLFKLKKPFALIGNMMQINYQEIGRLFADNPVQILSFDRKVSYNGNTSGFCSGYICNNFLPRDLIFEKLEHNNTGKNFVPSRMIV